MEPVTHFLTGACLSRTGFNRKTGLATAAMTLAAEAPDIDMLYYLGGSDVGFVHHRGFTHTLWGVPLVAAAVVAFLYVLRKVWFRLRPEAEQRWRTKLPVRWGLLYTFACISGFSHILLDFTNNYGVRPLWPFLNRWFSWDIVFIVEPLILLALTAALLLPALFGLVNTEIGARDRGPRGRGAAIAALAFVVLLWGVRDYQHRRAVAALDALEYQGEVPIRIGAYPTHTNPFVWHGVVETATAFHTMKVDSRAPMVDPEGRELVYYKSPDTEITRAAKASYLGRAYIDWSRFPVIEAFDKQAPEAGHSVRFRDLRFLSPERGRSPLAAFVELDPSLRVVDQGFEDRNVVHDRLDNRSMPGGE